MDVTVTKHEAQREQKGYERDSAKYEATGDAPPTGDYRVLFINMTNNCYVNGKVGDVSSPNQWFSIPTTCRTCNDDCDTCHRDEKWSTVLTVACNSGSFLLTLRTRPDQTGEFFYGTWNISPNCDFNGGSICLST